MRRCKLNGKKRKIKRKGKNWSSSRTGPFGRGEPRAQPSSFVILLSQLSYFINILTTETPIAMVLAKLISCIIFFYLI